MQWVLQLIKTIETIEIAIVTLNPMVCETWATGMSEMLENAEGTTIIKIIKTIEIAKVKEDGAASKFYRFYIHHSAGDTRVRK